MIPLFLASTSPRRKFLLEKYKIPFTIEPSEYEEVMTQEIPYQGLAQKLAYGKAKAVAEKHRKEDVLILSADTFVIFQGKYLGKPKSREEAENMLSLLSDNEHTVITAFVVMHPKSGKEIIQKEEAILRFHSLSPEFIKNHLDTHTYLDKAGAYAIFESDQFLKELQGDEETVWGLPVKKVLKVLAKFDTSYGNILTRNKNTCYNSADASWKRRITSKNTCTR